MPVQVFVVHFVCPAYCTYISIIASRKPFKALVNDHFVYNKISKAVKGNTKTNGCHPVCFMLQAQHDAKPAGYGKNEEECIILFKKSGALLVVIAVQVP